MEKRGEKSGYWILDARYWMLDAVISRIAILMEECIEKSVCKERVCVKTLTFGCLQAFSLVCAGRCKILVENYFCLKMKPTPAGWNIYKNNIQYRNSTPKESHKSLSFYFYKHLNPTDSDYLRTANSFIFSRCEFNQIEKLFAIFWVVYLSFTP